MFSSLDLKLYLNHWFLSYFEAFKYPIYGTQWHPEKNAFNWNPNYEINHSAHAIRIQQYMANFFVDQGQ